MMQRTIEKDWKLAPLARNYTMTIDILSLLLHLRNAIYLTSPITFTQQLIITRFNGANFYKVRLHIIK